MGEGSYDEWYGFDELKRDRNKGNAGTVSYVEIAKRSSSEISIHIPKDRKMLEQNNRKRS